MAHMGKTSETGTTAPLPPTHAPQGSPRGHSANPRLTVTGEGEGVAATVGSLAATTLDLVVKMTLAETTVLAAGGGETTGFAVLVDGGDDPVDAGIATDGGVGGVDEDDLVVLVGGVLVDPVGVEDAKVGATATDAVLSSVTQGALVLELGDTLVTGLTEDGTLVDGPLTTTTADANTVDNVTLLGLVAHATSLVGAGRTGGTVDHVQLAARRTGERESDDKWGVHVCLAIKENDHGLEGVEKPKEEEGRGA